ncbi:MAG: hypothetical protein NT030_05630 [Candidatus Saganbacteria bacterium]|nr:hypothetical protein [Candidatus Saganbacteria bacterium]
MKGKKMALRRVSIDSNYFRYKKALSDKLMPCGISGSPFIKTDRYPMRYEETTIITDPRDRSHELIYKFISEKQNLISNKIRGLMKTPVTSFHMTLLGVTQGEFHKDLAESKGINEVIARANKVLGSYKPPGFAPKFILKGFFPMVDVIEAGLEPWAEEDYNALINLRNTLLNDPVLYKFGVKDEEPGTFHITTHYFVKNETDRLALNSVLIDLNKDILDHPSLFEISYLIFARYKNLRSFRRIDNSPIIRFK